MSGNAAPHGGSPRALCRQTRRVYGRPAAPCLTSAARCATAAAQSPAATTSSRTAVARFRDDSSPREVEKCRGGVRTWVVRVMVPDAYLHGAGALLGPGDSLV